MKQNRIIPCAVALAGLLSFGGGQAGRSTEGTPVERPAGRPAFLNAPTPWADSVFSTLDLDQRIAQLVMVAAYSNKDEKHAAEITKLVKDRNIGGLIFFKGGPGRQATLTNRFQSAARTPLLIGMDLEWGLAMRLDSTTRFPKQMTLGALQDDAGIEAMGLEIARQMKRIGVHVSFSPVADVNNNPANPVINDRSFGEDRELVTRKSIAYMRGLQKGGVIATAKHFPGHGDTDTDSHHALPLITHARPRLDSLELYPFQQLVGAGIDAMMVAHLEVPALDAAPGVPTTLSKPVVADLLEGELGFKGLIFTDALNMKGVASKEKPGEIELRALLAGNDVLLFPQDPVKAIERIRAAVDSGSVPREMIDHKCLKILRAKEWAGLSGGGKVATKDLFNELNPPQAAALRRSLYADALTVVRNDGILPIKHLDSLKIVSLVIGDKVNNTFQQALGRYAPITMMACDKILRPDSSKALLERLKQYDVVIASVHGTSFRADKEFGIPQLTLDFLRRLDDQQPLVLAHFANPYRLATAYGSQRWDGIVVAYEENEDTQDLMAQALFGGRPVSGKLPVSALPNFTLGTGLVLPAAQRLGYMLPEEDGIPTASLTGIDAIVNEGITAGAFPGCQVLVAHKGKVVWDKAYGKSTYSGAPVRTTDLYDLASISKVAGTTLALMKLVDEGRVEVEATLGTYLPELKQAYPTHAAMKLSAILTHQAGFKAFVPFYKRIQEGTAYKAGLVAADSNATHTLRFGPGRYLLGSYRDTLLQWVLRTPLGTPGEYVYSDMGMYLLQAVVERVSGRGQDAFLRASFYAPMGLTTMGYQPWKRFPMERLMPTENDKIFRMQQVHGDVHDPGAAMMGGVAGHAGLFSNAEDLAVVMQMLLNGGTYGGQRFLKEATVEEFTKCRFCKPGTGAQANENRRALGWDKPQAAGKPGPACECVSYASFGHTGFTGTQVWADPVDGSLFVFLSNRVYPDAENKKITSMSIRTRIQEVVHAAVAQAR